METVHMKVILGLTLGLIAIITVVLSYFYPQYTTLILSIQAVVLTVAYNVGNTFIENKIKEDYDQIVSDISEESGRLDDKYQKARRRIVELEKEKGDEHGASEK